MKKLKEIYNKIYATLKRCHIFRLCASLKEKLNFITCFKKKQESNNPQLRKLMETKLTFRELKAEKIKLLTEKNLLTAKQSMIRYSKSLFNREIDTVELNGVNDRIYLIDDLITGIEAMICNVGFTYECYIKEKLPNGNDYEIWSTYKIVTLEKKYPEILSNDELIEIMIELNLRKDSYVEKIRLIQK